MKQHIIRCENNCYRLLRQYEAWTMWYKIRYNQSCWFVTFDLVSFVFLTCGYNKNCSHFPFNYENVCFNLTITFPPSLFSSAGPLIQFAFSCVTEQESLSTGGDDNGPNGDNFMLVSVWLAMKNRHILTYLTNETWGKNLFGIWNFWKRLFYCIKMYTGGSSSAGLISPCCICNYSREG